MSLSALVPSADRPLTIATNTTELGIIGCCCGASTNDLKLSAPLHPIRDRSRRVCFSQVFDASQSVSRHTLSHCLNIASQQCKSKSTKSLCSTVHYVPYISSSSVGSRLNAFAIPRNSRCISCDMSDFASPTHRRADRGASPPRFVRERNSRHAQRMARGAGPVPQSRRGPAHTTIAVHDGRSTWTGVGASTGQRARPA